MSDLTTTDIQNLAAGIAREMHEEHFDSHRGVGLLEPGMIYVYDNSPYHDPTQRPREHAQICAALYIVGAELLTTASYPTEGESAGYTEAHVYKCSDPEAAERCVHATWRRIVVGNATGKHAAEGGAS